MNMKDEAILKKLARDYLVARKKFRHAADKAPELNGNDNIIGRVGEFIAVQFLEHKIKRRLVSRNENMVQVGYDIKADGKKVSVKIITSENKSGRTTPIKDHWDELIIIELGVNSKVSQIGFISRDKFDEAVKDNLFRNSHPTASRSMLKDGGLFSRYGRIFTGKDLGNYL